ncbi:MAG: polyphosphate polymerase domain-containing protein [Lachnospiraceae bacterium]|nr:polyphosphate polymerase domain-containing protein [Lachnospiraceae bacterium]
MGNEIFKRYEIKYMVTKAQRMLIEEAFKEYMIPDAYGESTICNIYYDTQDMRLIRNSLEGPAYKEKLRVRSYGQIKPGENVFVELKKKYDGVVYKRRVTMQENKARIYLDKNSKIDNPVNCESFLENQIVKELDYFKQFYKSLKPAVYLCYDRTAYFSREDSNFRVTFDKNIRWRTTDMKLTEKPGGRDILDDGMSLMEVKTATAIPMWFVNILSKEKIQKTSFSKYGRAYMQMLEDERNDNIINYDFVNRKVG